jgi:indole-3-pyruvate monooxygenase
VCRDINCFIYLFLQFHVFTKEMIREGLRMVNYMPVDVVDIVITFLAKLKYGDLSKYGIYRPKEGPLRLKNITGKSAVIDVGTIGKIKEGAIKVIIFFDKR